MSHSNGSNSAAEEVEENESNAADNAATLPVGPFNFTVARLKKMEAELTASESSERAIQTAASKAQRRQFAAAQCRRTSKYKGVNLHSRSCRWDAHFWDKRQVHLGCFDFEIQAAVAYDIAALKVKGCMAQLNFAMSNYRDEMPRLDEMSFNDLVAALRTSRRHLLTNLRLKNEKDRQAAEGSFKQLPTKRCHPDLTNPTTSPSSSRSADSALPSSRPTTTSMSLPTSPNPLGTLKPRPTKPQPKPSPPSKPTTINPANASAFRPAPRQPQPTPLNIALPPSAAHHAARHQLPPPPQGPVVVYYYEDPSMVPHYHPHTYIAAPPVHYHPQHLPPDDPRAPPDDPRRHPPVLSQPHPNHPYPAYHGYLPAPAPAPRHFHAYPEQPHLQRPPPGHPYAMDAPYQIISWPPPHHHPHAAPHPHHQYAYDAAPPYTMPPPHRSSPPPSHHADADSPSPSSSPPPFHPASPAPHRNPPIPPTSRPTLILRESPPSSTPLHPLTTNAPPHHPHDKRPILILSDSRPPTATSLPPSPPHQPTNDSVLLRAAHHRAKRLRVSPPYEHHPHPHPHQPHRPHPTSASAEAADPYPTSWPQDPAAASAAPVPKYRVIPAAVLDNGHAERPVMLVGEAHPSPHHQYPHHALPPRVEPCGTAVLDLADPGTSGVCII